MTGAREVVEETAIEGGFIPLTAEPLEPWEADEDAASR